MTDFMPNIFAGNKKWRARMETDHSELMEQLAKGQSPKCLWIGCSDSRVPETLITGLMPGDFFVTRNIANTVSTSDLNILTAIYFAVREIKVNHLIVCGHTDCGGVKAALSSEPHGFLDTWLTPIKQTFQENEAELSAISDEDARCRRAVELHTMKQAKNLAAIPFVIEAQAERDDWPRIHACVYDVGTGELKELVV